MPRGAASEDFKKFSGVVLGVCETIWRLSGVILEVFVKDFEGKTLQRVKAKTATRRVTSKSQLSLSEGATKRVASKHTRPITINGQSFSLPRLSRRLNLDCQQG